MTMAVGLHASDGVLLCADIRAQPFAVSVFQMRDRPARRVTANLKIF